MLVYLLVCGVFACAKGDQENFESPVCGDGVVGPGEACDDGAAGDGDGCDARCQLEVGFGCDGVPSRCAPRCGDGIVAGDEVCDAGAENVANPASACGPDCRPRLGFECRGPERGRCSPVCGDNRRVAEEACDDGNVEAGDGCDPVCAVEVGFSCGDSVPTSCLAVCGDGVVVGGETCDDGNLRDTDGCSSSCVDRLRWRPIPGQPVPTPRAAAAAVWTGESWFVWGGYLRRSAGVVPTSGGALFDPEQHVWRGINPASAPSDRWFTSTVWTGSEVIVWGGVANRLEGDGARFDPVQNIWRKVSEIDAPTARAGAKAVWTGQEMLVFGGYGVLGNGAQAPAAGGGAYDPVADRWRSLATEGAPSARTENSAVWTGREMIVFGGLSAAQTSLGDGARYDPMLDAWRPISVEGAPSPRRGHAVVWTGTEMIVSGGENDLGLLADGAAYDPLRDVWRPIATRPPGQRGAYGQASWTGSTMVVLEGWPGAGAGIVYIAAVDTWVDLPREDAPPFGLFASVGLTPRELLVFGGEGLDGDGRPVTVAEGGALDLESRRWSPIPSGVDAGARAGHSGVVVGNELLVFGGAYGRGEALGSGARIDLVRGEARALSREGAPSPRLVHTSVASDREMLIFGGLAIASAPSSALGDGARYDLAQDRWTSLSSTSAPSARSFHTAILTDQEMIVWGGFDGSARGLADGARFDLASGAWRPLSAGPEAPAARGQHTAIWTGSEMIVWGGRDRSLHASGGRFDPALDRWRPTSLDGAPSGRSLHSAVWTGTELIVFGGWNGTRSVGDGARYDPALDRWMPLPREGAPSPRFGHSATWTGAQMVVFGGSSTGVDGSQLGDGARYDPALDAWLPLPGANAPGPRTLHTGVRMDSGIVIWGGDPAIGDGAILDL